MTRLQNERRIAASSSFTNLNVAESVVSRTIESNQSRIAAWLTSGRSNTLKLPFTGSEVIGRSVMQGETAVRDVNNATVILKKLEGGGIIFILHIPKINNYEFCRRLPQFG
ncbi:RNase A-like domain-containing protein [Chitinophaga sedimenti]|uniref:RNase A-like domain-containing protein n=1 Tax=Chitinophaga sedimenti TaxID=2033606 RepID=UPI0035589459